MPLVRYSQLRYLLIVLLAWLSVFFLTRSVLLVSHLAEAEVGLWDLLRLYGVGLAYDLGFLLYASAPLAIYLLLCPNSLWRRHWHQHALHALLTVMLVVMLFTAVAEWLFWDEFGVRFNFIAVDYLVYSKEVINNILESYPMYPSCRVGLVAIGIGIGLRKPVKAAMRSTAARSLAPSWLDLLVCCWFQQCSAGTELPARAGRQCLSKRTGEQWSISVLRGVSQ